jgi:hypothetical protein
MLRLTFKAAALARVLPTFAFRCGENEFLKHSFRKKKGLFYLLCRQFVSRGYSFVVKEVQQRKTRETNCRENSAQSFTYLVCLTFTHPFIKEHMFERHYHISKLRILDRGHSYLRVFSQ